MFVTELVFHLEMSALNTLLPKQVYHVVHLTDVPLRHIVAARGAASCRVRVRAVWVRRAARLPGRHSIQTPSHRSHERVSVRKRLGFCPLFHELPGDGFALCVRELGVEDEHLPDVILAVMTKTPRKTANRDRRQRGVLIRTIRVHSTCDAERRRRDPVDCQETVGCAVIYVGDVPLRVASIHRRQR